MITYKQIAFCPSGPFVVRFGGSMMHMLEWVCSWFKGLSHVDLGKVEMTSDSRRKDLGYFDVDSNR